ncbi:MAG: acyl-CoA thioesterase [Vicinamibacterales bacterium]
MTNRQPHFRCPIEVRFCDIDALGHVNNAVFFTYMEEARVAFGRAILGRRGLEGLDYILARAECDFRRPIRFGDSVEARVTVSALGRTSFTLDYELADPTGDPVFARARSVQVAYDFERRKPKPIPDEMRSKLEEYRSGEQPK